MQHMADKFRFKETNTIGVADAESDSSFLKECFVDNGLIDLLSDCRDHRRIVIGRTGAGKTALLSRLKERHASAVDISPESLALTYISNRIYCSCTEAWYQPGHLFPPTMETRLYC